MPMTLEEMVDKLYEDMYEGKGPNDPPITVRMDRVERIADSFSKNTNKIIIGAGLAVISTIVELISAALKHS